MAKHLQILRNATISTDRSTAKSNLLTQLATLKDGEIAVNRFQDGDQVKVLLGFNNTVGTGTKQFVFDMDAIPADVQTALDAITGDSGSITAIKESIIGKSGDASTADTIYGAKAYAKNYTDAQINALDVTDTKTNGSFVTAVSETNGKISVSRAAVKSTGKTVTVTANTDGSIDLAANVDGSTIVANSSTGKLSVDSSKLVQYVGSNAVSVSAVASNQKTISLGINSSDKVLSQSANGLLANISLTYDETNRLIKLTGKDSTVIASIDAKAFIKDGMLAGESVFMATSTSQNVTINDQTHSFSGLTVNHHYIVFQFAINDGASTTYSWDILDATDIIDVYKAGNGLALSADKHTFSVQKDSTSESFLSVSSSGVKVSGIQDAINTAKSAILGDAATDYNTLGKLEDKIQAVDKKAGAHTNVNAKSSGHVTVTVASKTNSDGTSYSDVTVAENDIASASGLSSEITRAKAAEDKVEASVGLNADGSHKTTTGNYTSKATTVVGEIAALDTQVKTNADAISTNATNIKALQDAKVSVAASTDTESAKYLSVTANTAKTVYTAKVSGVDAAIKVETDRAKAAETAIDTYVGKSAIPTGKTVMGVIEENEQTAELAITALATTVGVIDSEDKVVYTAPAVSGEFATTTSVMDMLNHIDVIWNTIDCGTY